MLGRHTLRLKRWYEQGESKQRTNNKYQGDFQLSSCRHLEFPYYRHRHDVDDQVRDHKR